MTPIGYSDSDWGSDVSHRRSVSGMVIMLSGAAVDRVKDPALDELVVIDTIPLSAEARACGKIRVLSCATLLAETIMRINRADSVSSLFTDE